MRDYRDAWRLHPIGMAAAHLGILISLVTLVVVL